MLASQAESGGFDSHHPLHNLLKPSKGIFVKEKLQKIARHPVTKKVLSDMKPEKSFWGIFGVFLFFIAPEIIAYFWASDIVHFAQNGLMTHPSFIERYTDELLIKLFEDGVSYLNLCVGIALFVWLFL